MEMNHREKEDAIRSRIASSFVVAIRLNPPGSIRSEIKNLGQKTSLLQSRWFGNRIPKERGGFTQVKHEGKQTAHSGYRCEHHLVFAPKYRRKVIYKALRVDIMKIIKKLCKEMKVEIIEGEACPDHIHLRVSIRYVYSTVRGDAQEQKCADDFR